MVEINDDLRDFYGFTVRKLSEQYGIPMPKKLSWIKQLTVCGTCDYSKQEIALSIPYCKKADYCSIYETIVHEMAHYALPGHSHDNTWRELYLKMGGSGEICENYESDVSKATARVLQQRK